MKNIINNNLLKALILLTSFIPLLTSCDEGVEGNAPPIIERVSLVAKDSTTAEGFRGSTYVIFGKNLGTAQAVYFNGEPAPLNVTMVRNDNIIIRIGDNTPFTQALNKLRVVTAYGEAVTDFVVRQRPQISGFSPAVAAAGEILTITGKYFDELQGVGFLLVDGDLDPANDVVLIAEIQSATSTELKVKVPEGAKVSYVVVATSNGIIRSTSSFGFNYIIYTDRFADAWENWSWSSTFDDRNASKVKSGQYAYRHTYTGAWGGLSFRYGAGIRIGDYTSLKLSILGGPGTAGKQLIVSIEGQGKSVLITLGEEWTDYTIPLSDLGLPNGQLIRLNIQDKGDTMPTAPYLMYIDDVGFL